MKAAQVVARGRVEFVEVPVPEVRPGHVLVRTQRLSLCGSDIRMLHHAPEKLYPFPPGTTGHEMIGVIEAIDVPGSPLRVGDTVLALSPSHQAMAEYLLAPIEHIVPLPAGVPIEQLLHAQQFGTVLYASKHLPDVSGKTVAVVGQGSAGLFFDFHLKRLGASRIVAFDLQASRLERSKAFGATHVAHNATEDAGTALREITGGELADVVVEAAGEVPAINLAVDLVRHGGDILFFGMPRGQMIPFNMDDFFHKCCRSKCIVGASVEADQLSTRQAMELIASRAIDVSKLTTHRFRFPDILAAYDMHRTCADNCLKILIEMPE
jgi:L-iditol 2-dehydrogenase